MTASASAAVAAVPRSAVPPAGGQAAALQQAIATYQGPLLRYAAQLLRASPDQAQDVVQETFLRLLRAWQGGQAIEHLPSWLYRVAHNQAMDLLRRDQRLARGEEAIDAGLAALPPAPAAHEALAQREAKTLAVAALDRLPANQRQILQLKTMHGLTLQQVADITGQSLSTVHYQLGQGLKSLAGHLRREGAI